MYFYIKKKKTVIVRIFLAYNCFKRSAWIFFYENKLKTIIVQHTKGDSESEIRLTTHRVNNIVQNLKR